MIEVNTKKVETAILIGVSNRFISPEEVMFSLDELERLVSTAGGETIQKVVQNRERIDSAFFIGKGKAEYIAEICNEKNVDIVVFDDDLSPVQVRNLENLTNRKVLDRSSVILDIFASHARTTEAKTQVELAQLEYLLPRLTRRWTHFSKQYGGIGTKGPGETQIETDRRLIKKKISYLKEKLRQIKQQKEIQRKQRSNLPRLALVGYTNAGKSTLMNLITGANVITENKLFSTLDTTVRKVTLSPSREFLISDTVGFIKKLPHHLIVSFLTTLSEAVESDILIHVIDISDPMVDENIKVVNETLKELNCESKPIIMVFNKIDLLKDRELITYYKQKYINSVFISAVRSININSFIEQIFSMLNLHLKEYTLFLKLDEQKLLSMIYNTAKVINIDYDENGIRITFLASEINYNNIIKFLGK
ncbi:MAG TPA: GTPase HflX [Ignavibacteria bacterium]